MELGAVVADVGGAGQGDPARLAGVGHVDPGVGLRSRAPCRCSRSVMNQVVPGPRSPACPSAWRRGGRRATGRSARRSGVLHDLGNGRGPVVVGASCARHWHGGQTAHPTRGAGAGHTRGARGVVLAGLPPPREGGSGTAGPSDDRPHHRGDAHHDHHTSGRRPRPDPRRGSAGEQPQGRQRRAAQAAADRLHRGLRLGQELAGLRDHRGGVAADDQRDLQRVRAGLHAHPRAARRRPPRGPDDGDHRRPGADGRQPALHGRHRHRRQRDAADPLQPARRPLRRPADGVLLQRPDPQGERDDDHREGRSHRAPDRQAGGLPRRHVPALRGHGQGQRHRPHRALRRGASRSPRAR